MSDFSKDMILASASPRRKEILCEIGAEFEIVPADIDESGVKAHCSRVLAKRLAKSKARHVANSHAGKTVIGADTIVVYRGVVYGKPQDRQNAFDMLSKLNGKWHVVYTGVCVVCGKKEMCFAVRSRVKFNTLLKEQIYAYIDDCKPYDKAGAYGIQDKRIVEKYQGSYTNIVGLPKEKLAKVLKRVGVTNGND